MQLASKQADPIKIHVWLNSALRIFELFVKKWARLVRRMFSLCLVCVGARKLAASHIKLHHCCNTLKESCKNALFDKKLKKFDIKVTDDVAGVGYYRTTITPLSIVII